MLSTPISSLAASLMQHTNLSASVAIDLLATNPLAQTVEAAIFAAGHAGILTPHQVALARLSLHFNLSPATAERLIVVTGIDADVCDKVRDVLTLWQVKQSKLDPTVKSRFFAPRRAVKVLHWGRRNWHRAVVVPYDWSWDLYKSKYLERGFRFWGYYYWGKYHQTSNKWWLALTIHA